jgi:hypothetical protein
MSRNMKWNKLGTFFISLSLVLALTSCSSISNLAVRYKCLSSSGLVIDDYTGKPIVGTTVQLLGSISLPRFPEGHEVRNVYLVTVTTDENGIFTIPAWTNEVAIDWDYFENTLISKPGNPPRINPYDFKGDVPPPHGSVIRTVTLRQNSLTKEELIEQEKRLLVDTPKEVLSNSLVFYTAHQNMVEDGRFIEARGLSVGTYIRPKPELIVPHIKSFSSIEASAFGSRDYKAIAITLLPADAKKLEVLRRTRVGADRSINEYVVMLGNKPTSSYWDSDPHFMPIGYLLFPKNQDTHDVEQFLKNIVQHK